MSNLPSANSIVPIGDFSDAMDSSNRIAITVHQTDDMHTIIGEFSVSTIDLFDYGAAGGLFNTTNGLAQVWISCFSPDADGSNSKIYSQFEGALGILSIPKTKATDKVLVHVMDGLGCPLRNKSNLVVKFELLEGESRRCVHRVSTSGSTHLRQLTWDQKVLIDLPFRVCDMRDMAPAALNFVLGIALVRPGERGGGEADMEVVADVEKSVADLLHPLSYDGRGSSRRQDFFQLILTLQLKSAFTSLESSKFSTSLSSSGSEVRLRLGVMLPDEKQTLQVAEEMERRIPGEINVRVD
jgi:hypothetical protein